MPEMTGLEVCMYLRGTSLAESVTICVLSQFGESHRALLQGLGVVDTLVKGQLSPDELSIAISKLLWRVSPDAISVAPAPEPSRHAPEITVGGRYVLEQQLGKGGMGQVFEARHLQLNKRFALKIMNRSFANDPEARARFIDEAKLASEISHPNIVSVVDFGEDAHFGAYMVMELIDGEPLTRSALSLRRACDVLGQIADALALIHRRGIVHGDVKAENIMLVDEVVGTRRRKLVRLVDFGLAHRISAPRRTSDMVSGTPHYLAPERALGESATVASDVYALGILGYYLISGKLPFDGELEEVLRAHVEAPPPPLVARRGEVIDPALEALILRALHKDYAQRHASVSAFRYELNTVMDMVDLGRRRPRTPPPAEVTAEARLAQTFAGSRFAQAVVGVDGRVLLANAAFRDLADEAAVETDAERSAMTNLLALVPGLPAALARAHAEGGTVECRGEGIVLRASDLVGRDDEVHLMVWVDETPR
jgi:serine/threonine-protein kinase